MHHCIEIPVIDKEGQETMLAITAEEENNIAFALGGETIFECDWRDNMERAMFAISEIFKLIEKHKAVQ